MLCHIVLFKLHDNVEVAKRKAALQLLTEFCQKSPLLESFRIAESLDARKGHIIIQNTLLKEGVSVNQWREDPKHKQVVEHMKQIADWRLRGVATFFYSRPSIP